MNLARNSAVVIAAAAALALSGCTPPPAHPHSLIDGDCIPGHWTNDIQTLAQEVADSLPETVDVVGVISSGTQTYDFTAEQVTIHNDFTIDISVALEEGHIEETAQYHHGTVTAAWALDGHELTMTGVDNGDYQVTTTVTVDGQGGSGTTIPVPDSDSSSFDDVCRGNGFTINATGADDLVSHLSRVGH